MNILLVGNYAPDRQQSMQFYAAMLERGLRARGHTVRHLRPPPLLGARAAADSAAHKWLGYLDKFALFRPELRRAAAEADVVHLCDHSNAMYVPALAHRPHVVTCHDILAIRSARGHFPENPTRASGKLLQRWIAQGLERAQAILCVSQKTRDDLHRYLHIPEDRLHVVPNALHTPYRPIPRAAAAPLLAAAGIDNSSGYFLYLGGAHWYKNRVAALAIFAELRRLHAYRNTRLVIAGSPLTTELLAARDAFALEDAVVETPDPKGPLIEALYGSALALLFPSLEEGFGWPILEAQACGCPVAIADRPPMNEVAGNAAILIDPANPAGAAIRIAQALEDPEALRTAGLANAAEYTEDKMLDACEALYQRVIAERIRKHR